MGDVKNCNTIEFLKFISTITCCSPRDAVSHFPSNCMWLYLSCNLAIVFYGMGFTDLSYYDETEILSEQYQRPYQYLVRLSDPTALLDTYTFTESHVTDDVKGFLSVVLKYV